jgi:hypothetical protein
MEVQECKGLDLELFSKADRAIRAADHLAYIIYPLLKDEKLLKQIFNEISTCTINIINATIYQAHKKGANLTPDKRQNFEFFKKYSLKFLTSEEIQTISHLFEIVEQYNANSIDFIRKDSFIIMINGSKTESMTLDKIKIYINALKSAVQKFRAYSALN